MKNLYDEIKMFSYWNEDKGLKCALEEYSPTILKAYPQIANALVNIKANEVFIRDTIRRLASKLEDDEDFC